MLFASRTFIFCSYFACYELKKHLFPGNICIFLDCIHEILYISIGFQCWFKQETQKSEALGSKMWRVRGEGKRREEGREKWEEKRGKETRTKKKGKRQEQNGKEKRNIEKREELKQKGKEEKGKKKGKRQTCLAHNCELIFPECVARVPVSLGVWG